MIAEVMGIFKLKEGSSPCAYFTSGVFRLTLAGMHFVDEYPGISRYSPKVQGWFVHVDCHNDSSPYLLIYLKFDSCFICSNYYTLTGLPPSMGAGKFCCKCLTPGNSSDGDFLSEYIQNTFTK